MAKKAAKRKAGAKRKGPHKKGKMPAGLAAYHAARKAAKAGGGEPKKVKVKKGKAKVVGRKVRKGNKAHKRRAPKKNRAKTFTSKVSGERVKVPHLPQGEPAVKGSLEKKLNPKKHGRPGTPLHRANLVRLQSGQAPITKAEHVASYVKQRALRPNSRVAQAKRAARAEKKAAKARVPAKFGFQKKGKMSKKQRRMAMMSKGHSVSHAPA